MKISYQQWRAQDGPLIRWTSSAASKAIGAGNGTRLAVVTACAGGAHGATYGAQLPSASGDLLTAANLGAVGAATADYAASRAQMLSLPSALGIAVTAALGAVQLGMATWNALPEAERQRVFAQAENLTDQVAPEGAARALRGLAGEVAGAAAGGLVGWQIGFRNGSDLGRRLVDALQQQLYKNMHTPSELQRGEGQ